MRLQNNEQSPDEQETTTFAKGILDIGDGIIGHENDGYSTIEIPEDLLITEYDDLIHAIDNGNVCQRHDSAEKPLEIDHPLYEFGSVEYHIQSQASNPQVAYLSISMSPLCHGVLPNELSYYTIEMVKGLCPNVVEIAEPAKEGYQLALKLNLNQIPRNKDYDKVIMEISTIHSVILSSQLKEILWNVNSDDALQGMYKPIKLLYHPKDLFVLIRQPQRIIAVFPIRFKEKSDVIIATNFFQEFVDVGNSDK
eukprot:XP_014627998.1 actin-related protein 2/3 complex subunit 2B [Glycine max]